MTQAMTPGNRTGFSPLRLEVGPSSGGGAYRGSGRCGQTRAESGTRHSRELHRLADRHTHKEQQRRINEAPAFPRPEKDVPEALLPLARGFAPPSLPIRPSDAPRSQEEFAQQDLEAFWRWCPIPIDGLHRCGLLVKLFDYCGLTRKEHKIATKVRKLDLALRSLDVLPTDQIQPNQRVPYEDLVLNVEFKKAIVRLPDMRVAWETKRRTGKCAEGRSPLALWVLSIISQDKEEGVPTRSQAHGGDEPLAKLVPWQSGAGIKEKDDK